MNFDELKNYMDHLTSWRIPGNVMVVYKDGRPVWEYCSGYSDLSKGTKMTMDKQVYMYSCSKITTTLAALQLYEKGVFLLDDPLYDFMPAFKDMTVREKVTGEIRPAASPITMRQLLTMTAGFNYNHKVPAFEKAREKTGGRFDTVTTINELAAEPLDFDPGTHWQYSLGHDVLAAAVEVMAGKKFRTYVKENIFDPLEIKASYEETAEVKENMAMMYYFMDEATDTDPRPTVKKAPGGRIVEEGLLNMHILGADYDSGGAGIIASVPEYGKLMAALANGGISVKGERILSKGTMELWRADQLTESQHAEYNWDALKGYGYGLGVRTMIDRAKSGSNGSIGEFGWNGAAGAGALIDPDRNVAFCYAHHMLNNQEAIVQPRLRNILYASLDR